MGDSDTGNNTDLINSADSTYNIKTDGNGTSASNWKLKFTVVSDATIAGSYNTYQNIPSAYTKVASYTNSTASGIITPHYQINLVGIQQPGTYVGQVKYTLFNPSNAATPDTSKTIANSSTMQEVESCPNTIPENQVYTLSDPRDGNSYRVARLKDGNCWMLDNLRLDITAVSLDDLKGNTNADDISLTYLKNGGGSGHYATTAVSKAWTSSSQDYYDRPMIAVDSVTSGSCYNAYCVNNDMSWSSTSITPATINNVTSLAQGKIGIYYNYCAASAGYYCYASNASVDNPDGTITLQDSKYDICPRGWRLPTSTVDGEFQTLYSQYANDSPNQIAAFQTAFSTYLSGTFQSGQAYYQGSCIYIWSSTWYDAYRMNYLWVSGFSDSVSPSAYSFRNTYGNAVRCILNQ